MQRDSGIIRYRPQVMPVVIILGILFILSIFADYYVDLEQGSGISFSRTLFSYVIIGVPLLAIFFYGIAKLLYILIDRSNVTITYRDFFVTRTAPIAAIRRIEYGGTYIIAKGTYKSLFVIYEKPDGSESFLNIRQASFHPRDLGDFIRNLLKLNPSIVLNPAAQKLMEKAGKA